jgi:probable phosphoglycerate mutase
MNTILYLVRHGETVDNASQRMQGQTQGRLNETGVGQARQLRDELAATHFDAVVASDLKRAVDTARILAEPHGLEVETTELLRERDWGSFTGRYIPSLKGEVWPDDIESLDDLLARAGRFLDYIKIRYASKTVLAVGHGIVNKAIQAVFYGKQMREVERMTNCEVRILELS